MTSRHPQAPRHHRRRTKLAMSAVAAVAALALFAAACGSDDDDTGDDPTPTTQAPASEGTPTTQAPVSEGTTTTQAPVSEATTTEAPDDDLGLGLEPTTTMADSGGVTATTMMDPCEGAELESTEIGVTEDTIKVLVMADVGSALAPGLFQGSIDGTNAWANYVNANGGLACRQIEVIEHDSQISSAETTNGFLIACEEAVSLIGSTALFAFSVGDLNTCPDSEGNEIGIPDIPERAVEVVHACSPNTFAVTNAMCPYEGSGPRTFNNVSGAHKWVMEQAGGPGSLNGVFLIPSDLASAINASMPGIRAHTEFGVANDGEFGISGLATQAEFGQLLERMREADSNYAYTGSDDNSMLKWKREAVAQGFDLDPITWMCSLACYTSDFIEDEVSNGTYLWMQFLPFEEADANEELATFMEYIDKETPDAWSAGAWAAGRLFEQAVNNIVERDGLNGITRQALLNELRATESYDVNGWYSPFNFETKINGPCFVLLQVQNQEFVRVYPEERGTFDCNPDNIWVNTIDPSDEFQKKAAGYLEERQGAYDTGEEDEPVDY